MNKSKKTIVFDSFGVVFTKGLSSSIDSLASVFESKQKYAIEYTYRKWEREFDLGRINDQQFWGKVNEELGTNVTADRLTKIVIGSYKIQPDIIALILLLRLNFNLVMYSNFRKSWFDILDNKFDVYKLFDKVFISSEAGYLKPDKKAFDYISKQLNISPSNLILVDDEKANIDSFNEWGGNGILFQDAIQAQCELRKELNGEMPNYASTFVKLILHTTAGSYILDDLIISHENEEQLFSFKIEGNVTTRKIKDILAKNFRLKGKPFIVADGNSKNIEQIGPKGVPVGKDGKWNNNYYYLIKNINYADFDMIDNKSYREITKGDISANNVLLDF